MQIAETNLLSYHKEKVIELYTAIVIADGDGSCQVDSGTYAITGPCILFVTPFQKLKLSLKSKQKARVLQFHGDFYCIEFHKPEVACNGLLFNNVYLSPLLALSTADYLQVDLLLKNFTDELSVKTPDRSISISYLQLFLALSSRIKKNQIGPSVKIAEIDEKMESLKALIDQHFISKRSPTEYAKILGINTESMTKRCKRYFSKTPSQLIHERLILEARKKLHLTRQSVKEIAFSLQFEDEHYFSRFFKKAVGVSPVIFRKKAGISVVADLPARSA